MKRGKVNKPVLHCWIETLHIVHIAILIWRDVWEITFHTFHTFQNMVYALWLVKIDNGSDVMNTTSHRVYQTREGGKRKGPRTTSDVWESGYPMWANRRQSWTLDSRNWISDSLSVEFGFQIPIVSGIPWAEFRVPKPWSGIYKQKILGLGIAKQYFLDSGIRLTLNEACTVAICNNHRTL